MLEFANPANDKPVESISDSDLGTPSAQPNLITQQDGSAPARLMRFLLKAYVGQCIILLAIALFARAHSFGDPNYHVDETFYMLVGKAMHQGMAPYIDIWDRKPPGLFVLYWILAAFSGTVWSIQVASLIFVTATAFILTRIAERWASQGTALIAGVVYITFLQPLLGGGGQSPVFYNLFICYGVLLLIQASEQPAGHSLVRRGVAASLLAGIAVSIKPTAVFEGVFIVLGFCWLIWGRSWRLSSIGQMSAIALVAALPMLVIFAWYATTGDFTTFWQATVLSNFEKHSASDLAFSRTANFLFLTMFPILVGGSLGWFAARHQPADRLLFRTSSLWLIAAICGFLAVPNFYSHYALPLVPVLAVLCARYFSQSPLGPRVIIFTIGWALITGQSFDLTRGLRSKAQFDQAASVIRANLHGGPLYVFDGPPGLYTTPDLLPKTRYLFPMHLSYSIERNALGTNSSTELIKILDENPDIIIMNPKDHSRRDFINMAILRKRLDSEFVKVCDMPLFDFGHEYQVSIFSRSMDPDRKGCMTS